MIWPWQRLRSSDFIVPCKCGSTQPAVIVLRLHNAVQRKGKLLLIETGARVACQVCGQVWSVGPMGKFEHSPRALPYSPAMGNAPEAGAERKEQRAARIVPMERP